MAIYIYESFNYLIVEEVVGENKTIYEYAKGHTLYTFKNDVYTIKELTQGEYKVTREQLNSGQILKKGGSEFSEGDFVDFLRENTGFKTASGGSEATVQNSDLTYNTTVSGGGTLTLPDITVTDSDGSTYTKPAVNNITCTPTPAPVGATLMKTGQTTSYRTGDDGDLEAGRATSFTVLASNNPFGNTNRFTDELGGQTYTNNWVIDWSTYNGSTVLGYFRTRQTAANWNTAIDNSLGTFGTFSGCRLANVREMMNLFNFSLSLPINYAPFSWNTTGNIWTSTTRPDATNAAYLIQYQTGWTINGNVDKATSYVYIPVRNFTVTGTTLT